MPNHKLRILAIDPGTKAIGIASFEGKELVDYAVKPIRRGRTALEILTNIEQLAEQLLQQKRPHVVVLEKNLFSQVRQNALLTLSVYKLKAVARRAAVPVRELAPNTIRKLVCGNGNASKRDVVKVLLGTYPELGVFVEPGRRWKQRYFMNMFDAIAAGAGYLRQTDNDHVGD